VSKFTGWRWWCVWLVLGAVLLGAAFYFDADVTRWVASHHTHSGKSFMRQVSKWGDWPLHVAIGLAGAGIAYLLGNRRWTTIFAAMVLACAVAGLFNPVLKVIAGRSRPAVEKNIGWNGPNFHSKYHSFPSGHTISSTAFFATLVCARRRIGLLFLPIPLLIAASRIYVNAHHLSDVVAGAILGVCCAVLVWRFVSARVERERPGAR
jgi:undecaprenyl-diphosphatase